MNEEWKTCKKKLEVKDGNEGEEGKEDRARLKGGNGQEEWMEEREGKREGQDRTEGMERGNCKILKERMDRKKTRRKGKVR